MLIVLDHQEAKTLLQERVKLIERVDMDVNYNIEGNVLSFYQLGCVVFLFVCLFVCLFPFCSYLGKDRYLIKSTQNSEQIIDRRELTNKRITFTDYVRQMDELLAKESEKITELRGESCFPCLYYSGARYTVILLLTPLYFGHIIQI